MTRRAGRAHTASPPLHRALDQTEKLQEKVKEAAADLTDVNVVLKDHVAQGAPLAQVQHALDKSDAVEAKVHEAAEELAAVNATLAEEVEERDALEHRIRQGESALSQSVAAEEAARDRALHDAVTGLPNSTLFSDRLETALEQADRHAWRLAVMFLDLDGFKQVNDRHGHDIGDRVLLEVAERLRDTIRGEDSVGRRGGDEFLVLALEVKSDASAITLATKICERIAEPMVFGDVTVTVGTSIGIALYPDDATRPTELLKCADIAMYVAKEGGLGAARYAAVHHPSHPTAPALGATLSKGDSA
jgi:diguanylate cyclase (GGDEF)-like protein